MKKTEVKNAIVCIMVLILLLGLTIVIDFASEETLNKITAFCTGILMFQVANRIANWIVPIKKQLS